jgi:hypothetical protein
LGLQDYQGTHFPSYERYVTLVLLGYMVLEYQRLRGLLGRAGQDEPPCGWAQARTAALLRQVRREAHLADLRWIEQRLKTPSGRRLVRQALRRGQRRQEAARAASGARSRKAKEGRGAA